MPTQWQEKLLDFYYKKLEKALKSGYKKSVKYYSIDLANSLQKNIIEFAAFKEASFRNALIELINDNDYLPTWSEFKSKALDTADLYNKHWLQTEYDQTISTANMAGKYKQYQQNLSWVLNKNTSKHTDQWT